MLRRDKVTVAEAEKTRKFLMWFCDYLTKYGPDHGFDVDESGQPKFDVTARGYQAAMEDGVYQAAKENSVFDIVCHHEL
jgi:hypothetical protein